MKIIAIKSNDGVYLSDCPKGYQSTWLPNYNFDGEQCRPTFHKDWVLVGGMPNKITKKVTHGNINYRLELIDKSFLSDKVPAVLIREEVCQYEDCEWIWNEEHKHLYSLYELKSDSVPDTEEEVEFEIEVIAEIEKIMNVDFNFNVNKTQWASDGLRVISADNVKHQILDKIIFPEILLPMKPCSFSSDDTYKIVRQYVKENINPKVVKITSDYDFCFTVKKIIPLSSHEKYTVDTNNSIFDKRKRKPKYQTRYRKNREAEIFEMTPASKGYQGYTVIQGVRAKNHEDLKEKMDFYLKSLIEFINQPVSDCPHCNGDGVIIQNEKPELKSA